MLFTSHMLVTCCSSTYNQHMEIFVNKLLEKYIKCHFGLHNSQSSPSGGGGAFTFLKKKIKHCKIMMCELTYLLL
jgi:hypothetical protein